MYAPHLGGAREGVGEKYYNADAIFSGKEDKCFEVEDGGKGGKDEGVGEEGENGRMCELDGAGVEGSSGLPAYWGGMTGVIRDGK